MIWVLFWKREILGVDLNLESRLGVWRRLSSVSFLF